MRREILFLGVCLCACGDSKSDGNEPHRKPEAPPQTTSPTVAAGEAENSSDASDTDAAPPLEISEDELEWRFGVGELSKLSPPPLADDVSAPKLGVEILVPPSGAELEELFPVESGYAIGIDRRGGTRAFPNAKHDVWIVTRSGAPYFEIESGKFSIVTPQIADARGTRVGDKFSKFAAKDIVCTSPGGEEGTVSCHVEDGKEGMLYEMSAAGLREFDPMHVPYPLIRNHRIEAMSWYGGFGPAPPGEPEPD